MSSLSQPCDTHTLSHRYVFHFPTGTRLDCLLCPLRRPRGGVGVEGKKGSGDWFQKVMLYGGKKKKRKKVTSVLEASGKDQRETTFALSWFFL